MYTNNVHQQGGTEDSFLSNRESSFLSETIISSCSNSNLVCQPQIKLKEEVPNVSLDLLDVSSKNLNKAFPDVSCKKLNPANVVSAEKTNTNIPNSDNLVQAKIEMISVTRDFLRITDEMEKLKQKICKINALLALEEVSKILPEPNVEPVTVAELSIETVVVKTPVLKQVIKPVAEAVMATKPNVAVKEENKVSETVVDVSAIVEIMPKPTVETVTVAKMMDNTVAVETTMFEKVVDPAVEAVLAMEPIVAAEVAGGVPVMEQTVSDPILVAKVDDFNISPVVYKNSL